MQMLRKLCGKTISPVGLGCMGMSEFYGPADDKESLAALRYSYDLGYRHFDTADMYGLGHNESLLGKFLHEIGKAQRDQIVVATKAGIVRSQEDKFSIGVNGKPDYIREACHESLKRLRIDHIDLYYLHRRDPSIPIEESIAALNTLRIEGKIGGIGLCEVSAETLDAASKVAPITALQSEYSLWTRDIENEILPKCVKSGIAIVAFSPLGRGFLTGKIDEQAMRNMDPELDLRTRLPRFSGSNIARNQAIVADLECLSKLHGVTPAQLALSWLLHKSSAVHVIPGSKTVRYLKENQNASLVTLDQTTILELDRLFAPAQIAGERYPSKILEKSNG